MEVNYKPKYFDCILNDIVSNGSKQLFKLVGRNSGNLIDIEVD